ncbi:hypothetical protein Cgig2_031926 [Carnegiea gigantea]|uniref:NAC domain-containing protein n=1 Tax=Carnegiea gigantea TaxID=171969 RepID=A0A9Q1GQV1_9CARY|nr:hypothetical protein Cgig2_031926 [Carnegiea gigantea]
MAKASHSPVEGGTFGHQPELPQSSVRESRPNPVTQPSTSDIQDSPVPGFSNDRIQPQPSTGDPRPNQATRGSSSRSLEKMSSLSMVEAKLPPGFRFHPRDDELVCDYLIKKWSGCESPLLIEVDLNKCEPWDIPETACVGGKEWYFYSQRDKKYATGSRTNRATISGYWKATGKDKPVVRRGTLMGMRKTLVFYQGRAPKGRKTDWVMHEFRVEGPFGPPKSTATTTEDWVLCRVFCKNKEEAPTKSDNTGNDSNNCVDETASSSLPPLTDSYISFDQSHHHQHNTNNYNQQVPCFSIYSNTPNPNPTPIFPQIYPNLTPTKNPNFDTPGGSATNTINPLACDNRVIEAVLSHLTKMENSENRKSSPASLGEAVSSESYLSVVGLPPNMWNNHY